MTDELQNLPDDPALLKKLLLAEREKNHYLMEQFRLAQQKAFGASGEAHPGQGQLFNEAESEELTEETGPSTVEGYTRNKPKRKPLPADLPREVIVLDIPDEDKVCQCGGTLQKIGEDRSERLEFIPAQVKVIETVRPKYVCRCSEKEDEQAEIKQAPVPPAIIPKGIATPSLLSQIITSKYQYGLPLYRQESMFKQYGIDLSRKTMADWMIRCSELLEELYILLRQLLLKQSVIQADETTLKVVNEEKSTCYMWLYCSGADSPVPGSSIPNIVLYDYQRSRSGQCPVAFLDGYNQYLQVDGYGNPPEK